MEVKRKRRTKPAPSGKRRTNRPTASNEKITQGLSADVLPEKTLFFVSKYRQGFAEEALQLLVDGGSLYSVCRALGVSLRGLHIWTDKHPEFAEAIQKGLDMSRGWWEDVGRLNLQNKDFNNVLWMMNMSNRFQWRRDAESGQPGNNVYVNNMTTNSVSVKEMSQEDLEQLASIMGRQDG